MTTAIMYYNYDLNETKRTPIVVGGRFFSDLINRNFLLVVKENCKLIPEKVWFI